MDHDDAVTCKTAETRRAFTAGFKLKVISSSWVQIWTRRKHYSVLTYAGSQHTVITTPQTG